MTYNVFGGTLNLAQSNPAFCQFVVSASLAIKAEQSAHVIEMSSTRVCPHTGVCPHM